MKLKTVPISSIKPYEHNPRRNDDAVDAVAESIRQCSYVAPIVVDENNVILAGHTRWKALQQLGRTTAHHNYRAGAFRSTIWDFPKPTASRPHPTMKPVALVANAILDGTLEGMTVLDPFGGSGTTLIACEQTGRCCRMLEIDPHYCDVIIRRWEEFTGEKAALLDGV